MDENEAVITMLFDLLTDDTDLKTAMGGTIRLYHVWAEPDAQFPYLVHRLGKAEDEPPIVPGIYYLDIWDYSETSNRVWDIRKRIATLIDETSPMSGNGVHNLRLFRGPEGFVPEDTRNIQHYASIWRARYGNERQL